MNKKTFFLAGFMTAGLFLAGCSKQPATSQERGTPTANQDTSSPPSAQATPNSSPVAASPTNADVRVIEVEAGSFYFKPDQIKIKKGEKVRIVLKSVSMMHDFVVDELKIKVPVTRAGQTGTVEFVADKTGTFEYYCSMPGHKASGQKGTLIVE